MRRAGWVVVVGSVSLAWLGGCQEPPTQASCPEVYFDGQIDVPATSALLGPPINSISAQTISAPPGVSVSITNSQGTVAYGGRDPVPAFLFLSESQSYNDGGRLYGGLGVGDGVWYPFWLYCSKDGRLTYLFGEMTDQDVDIYTPIDGTCIDMGVPATGAVQIPAQTLRHVALTCGFTVDAPGAPVPLALRGSQPGQMSYGADTAIVLPFHGVDCRTGCGQPGWYELHTIISDPTRSLLQFSVLYLYAPDSGVVDNVFTDSGIELPTGAALQNVSFPNATFTLSR